MFILPISGPVYSCNVWVFQCVCVHVLLLNENVYRATTAENSNREWIKNLSAIRKLIGINSFDHVNSLCSVCFSQKYLFSAQKKCFPYDFADIRRSHGVAARDEIKNEKKFYIKRPKTRKYRERGSSKRQNNDISSSQCTQISPAQYTASDELPLSKALQFEKTNKCLWSLKRKSDVIYNFSCRKTENQSEKT